MSVAWSSSSSSSSSSSRCPPPPPAQLRLAIHSFLCRTSTTTIHGLLDFMPDLQLTWSSTIHVQSSLPDLNSRCTRASVFPAGPEPRPSTPSVPCRTSTTNIPAQCSLQDLNHDHPRPVFPAGPQPRVSTPSVPCRTSTTIHECQKISLPDLPDLECHEDMLDDMPDRMSDRMPEDMPDRMPARYAR